MRIFSAKTDTLSKISLLFGRDLFDHGEKPSLGEVPGALDRSLGNVQHAGNFGVAQADKEPELDHFGLHRVQGGQLIQRLVHLEQALPIIRQRHLDVLQLHSLLTTPMTDLTLAARDVDENSPHRFSGSREEMSAVLPQRLCRPDQAEPGFVNESGGLKRLPRRFVRHFLSGQATEFFVNERQQFLGGFGIALLNPVEDLRDVAHTNK